MKVAFIVQRYGTEVVGGSETLARCYAQSLKDLCEVEVLTTCALDHGTWANHYPPGVTVLDGVPVHRFANDFERGPYWGELYRLLLGPMEEATFAGSPAVKQTHAQRMAAWPRALQEETIYWQGPYSSTLFDYLAQKRRAYDVFLFFAYLFPTSYFGMQCVPRERIAFCPTLHDEPLAYLPTFRQSFRRANGTIFLTEAERALAHRLHGFTGPSEVVGMALVDPPRQNALPPGTPPDYVLYAGRIETLKGLETLFAYFLEYKRRYPSALKLVLIGTVGCTLPDHPDVVYLGFVTEAEKFALMRQARVFIHPSPYESFSIVLLESFLMETPALVNGYNDVLVEHCRHSGAGLGFGGQEEFTCGLQYLLTDEEHRRRMGQLGRRYVQQKFLPEQVTSKLWQTLTSSLQRPQPVENASNHCQRKERHAQLA
jgi:glycosyltransferase involved in cell wall biosynthesis